MTGVQTCALPIFITYSLRDYIPQLKELRDDTSLPIYQTNVVFLVPDMAEDKVDRKSVVQGKSVDLGGRRIIKKKK